METVILYHERAALWSRNVPIHPRSPFAWSTGKNRCKWQQSVVSTSQCLWQSSSHGKQFRSLIISTVLNYDKDKCCTLVTKQTCVLSTLIPDFLNGFHILLLCIKSPKGLQPIFNQKFCKGRS